MVSSVLRAALLAALVVVGSAKPYGNQAPTLVVAAPPAKAPSSDYAAPAMDIPVVQPVVVPANASQTYAAMQASSAESHEELAVHQVKPSIVEGYFAMAVAAASLPTETAKPTPLAADTPKAPVAQPSTYGSAPAPVTAVVEELPLNRLTAPAASSYGQQPAPVATVQTPSYNSAPAATPLTVEVPVAVQIPIEKLSEYSAKTPLAPIQVVELPTPAAASYNAPAAQDVLAPTPSASYGQPAPILPQPIVVAMPSTPESAGQSYGAQPTPVLQAAPALPEAPATPSYNSQAAPTPIVVVMPTKQQDVATPAYAVPVQQPTPSFVQPAETPKPTPSYAAELPAVPAPQPILVMPAAPASASYAAPMQFDTPAIAQPTPLKTVAVSAY